MAEEYKVIATVTGLKGHCNKGHKVGDQAEVSIHETGGLCSLLFYEIFPTVMMFQHSLFSQINQCAHNPHQQYFLNPELTVLYLYSSQDHLPLITEKCLLLG